MKTRRKVNSSKRKKSLKIEDIIFAPKKKVLSLKEKVWRIELRTKDIKFFFENNRRYFIIGSILLVCVIGLIGYWTVTKANIVNLYPDFCLGDWRNPQNAAGLPNLPLGAEINLFNEENSTVLEGDLKQIFCGDFKGEISEGKIKKVKLKFSLAVKQRGEGLTIVNSAEILEIGTPTSSEILPTSTEQIQNPPSVSTSTSTSVPSSTSSENQLIIPPEQSPEKIPEENPILEPTSFLFKISKTAFAQTTQEDSLPTTTLPEAPQEVAPPEETPQTPLEIIQRATTSEPASLEQSTSSFEQSSIEPQPIIEYSLEGENWQLVSQNNNLLEISYTLDAQNWQSLGMINKENWQNLTYEIPIADWNDLLKIQIKIQSLPVLGGSLMVYLDGMWLEVEYEKIGKEEIFKVGDVFNEGGGLTSEEVLSFEKSSLEFSQAEILDMKTVPPSYAALKIKINQSPEIWLFDLHDQSKIGYRIAWDKRMREDSPIGIKGGYLFWLSEDDKIYAFNLEKKEYATALESIPWKVVFRANEFYFYSDQTGEVFSDDDSRIKEQFYNLYLKDLPKNREDLIQLHLMEGVQVNEEILQNE